VVLRAQQARRRTGLGWVVGRPPKVTLRYLLLTFVLVAPVPAWAQDAEISSAKQSEALALEAHQVLVDHCAQAAGGATTKAAKSVVLVSDVWARVSAHLEESEESYLLYWRGVLEQCLDQEDRALTDLRNFVESPAESDLLMELVRDARKRIRRLERAQTPQASPQVLPQTIFGLTLGFGLAAGSAVSGSVAGWHWGQALSRQDQLTSQVNTGAQINDIRADMEAHEQASHGLAALGVGLGVGSAISFVVTASSRSRTGGRAAVGPPIISPMPGGSAVLWNGRW